MNARNLGILSVAALLIIVAAIWAGHSQRPDTLAEQSLYPDLKEKLDAVSGISIYKAGDQLAVDAVRDNDAWRVKQRNNFPADPAKVKSLLLNLGDAKLREQKTANAANYSALAVQDVTDPSTTGVRIALTGAPTAVNLIVGKHDAAARTTYVRRVGDKQSWLIGAELDVSADPAQWLKRDIINVSGDRIQEATTQLAGQPSYTATKKTRADANFDVKPLPKGRELNSVSAPNAVAQALISLQLDDVRPVGELASEKPAGHTTFRTFDGLVVDCSGYTQGDRRWITFRASFDPELAKRFHVETTTAEKKDDQKQADKKESDKKAPTTDTSLETSNKKVQDEVAELNKNLDGWAFAVPTYKYDAIFKPLDDLLKKPELPKKPSVKK